MKNKKLLIMNSVYKKKKTLIFIYFIIDMLLKNDLRTSPIRLFTVQRIPLMIRELIQKGN